MLRWHIFYDDTRMIKTCRHFTATVEQYLQMRGDYLELFCKNMEPDEHFRFVTFEKNDYRSGNLTCQLYNYVPEKVFFSVETPMEIEAALDKLIELNPGVEWSWAALHHSGHDQNGITTVIVELKLCAIPLRVNTAGHLICL